VRRGRELGVDVEEVRPLHDAESIAARYFSVGEVAALRALPPAERTATLPGPTRSTETRHTRTRGRI
jgi:phosphopantetheinyl transferase